MPRKKKDFGFKPWQKKAASIDKGFIRYHYSFIDTKLYWQMKPHSRDVYQIMLRKYNGRNDQELVFPYDAVEGIMSKPTFHSCIKELINNGYLEFVEHNRFTRKSNIYKFSDKWRDIATENMKY
jgi:hypothetical protein